MKYTSIRKARFISRPNRFIANIEINGQKEICHVKNTGRCKELLIAGTEVFVQEAKSDNRKTKYDLIGVYKGERLINIDSQAPNRIFHEWVLSCDFFEGSHLIKPEYKYNSSRFDFYIETGDRKILVEVKGVTLEEDGVALFPDAPTERGIKHLTELSQSIEDGYEAYLFFIIQMKGVLYFTPNYKTHTAFGKSLSKAAKQGVKVIALDCEVAPDAITARDYVSCNIST
jgi:sugar fermentation stimulation protein A